MTSPANRFAVKQSSKPARATPGTRKIAMPIVFGFS
jgi:hypothetical protein